MILKLILFSVIIAFIAAKFEINIEGKHGWGANLPTWRVKNWLTRIFWGEQPYTGYHFWFLMMAVGFLHLPFVVGLPWSLSMELLLLASFLLTAVLEDFFWFLLNPHYGLKKFNKTHVNWHADWVGWVPRWYLTLAGIAAVFVFISTQIK